LKVRRQIFALSMLAGLLAGTDSFAQDQPLKPSERKRQRSGQIPGNRLTPDRQGGPGRVAPDTNEPDGRRRTGPRAGDWLRRYKDVPPAEQDKALANDTRFQGLPPEKQDALRDRLREFNSMSPEKKEKLLDRMSKFESMSKEQRERLQDLHQRMHQIPEGRRTAVRDAFREVRDMSPEQRQRFFGSDRFRTGFSDSEREILKGLAEINEPETAGRQKPPLE
jgi:hypothetical protein